MVRGIEALRTTKTDMPSTAPQVQGPGVGAPLFCALAAHRERTSQQLPQTGQTLSKCPTALEDDAPSKSSIFYGLKSFFHSSAIKFSGLVFAPRRKKLLFREVFSHF